MKKLAVFILILIPFVAVFLLNTASRSSIFDLEDIDKVCVATTDNVSGKNVVETLGYNYIYLSKSEVNEKIDKIKVDGISFYIKNTDVEKIIKSLNMLVFSEEKMGNKRIIYGYTPKYCESKIINNKKINVQMVVDQNKSIVGFPLILGGF